MTWTYRCGQVARFLAACAGAGAILGAATAWVFSTFRFPGLYLNRLALRSGIRR